MSVTPVRQGAGMWMRMPEQGPFLWPFASRTTSSTRRSPSDSHGAWRAGSLVLGALGAGAKFRTERSPKFQLSSAGSGLSRLAAPSIEVDEETQLQLQRELANWGDEELDESLDESLELEELADDDWRKWAPKVSKERVWTALKGKGSSSDEWKEVILALRRGDALTSTEEYAKAFRFLAEKKEGWRDAEVILQCMWFNGFFPDHRHYSLVMLAMQRTKRWEKITNLFEEMVEHDIKPSVDCYNLAIQAYGRRWESDGALQLLQALKADGHRPTLESYHGLLHALAKEGAWVKSLELFDDMLDNGVEPTRKTFDLLVLAYSNGGEFDAVVQTIEYMQKMGLPPSVHTFLYGMRAAERACEINLGLDLFRRMKARGIKTNEKIDEALMRISLAANDPDRALQFFDAAIQRRQNWGRRNPEEPVRQELCIYRQALRACELGAASGWPPGGGVVSYQDYALQLLLDLQNGELPIDAEMYLHAVSACEYQGAWMRVIALLMEMKEKGIKVEGDRLRSAYWNGLQAAEEDDNVDQAFELFEQMREQKFTVEPFMYISMVQILEKHGQLARAQSIDTEFQELQLKEFSQEVMIHRNRNEWQEAIGVLDKIREQNLTPTLKVFNTALSALQRPGKWELVLELMSQMENQGYILDACSHTVAISAMITAGEIQRAVQHLQSMKQRGVPPTSLTYGRLIYALEAAGQPEQALYLWDELRSKHIEPDRVAYEATIRACRRCEFWEPVLELYAEMQEKDKGPSKASREAASLAAERLGLTESVMAGATTH